MISRLQGRLIEVNESSVVVDVHGVGYGVSVSASTLNNLPAMEQEIVLEIYTHVREDMIQLYGFLDKLDCELFKLLLKASGVGPKLAIQMLSQINGETLLDVLMQGKVQQLNSVPGIGKKKAEKLVLELKDKCKKQFSSYNLEQKRQAKVAKGGPTQSALLDDLQSALIGLGYREMDVLRVVESVDQDLEFEAALKVCLRQLASKSVNNLQGRA